MPEATRRGDPRLRADSQRDRKVDPDRPGAARQDPDSQTAPNSDRQKCRQAGPDSWAHGARSGRHSTGHTDEAAAPGTPAFLGTLPGSSNLPWPPGGLRPAGPPALPRVQADRGLIQGAGCAEAAASGGCWPGARPVVQMHCTPFTEVRQSEAGGCRRSAGPHVPPRCPPATHRDTTAHLSLTLGWPESGQWMGPWQPSLASPRGGGGAAQALGPRICR